MMLTNHKGRHYKSTLVEKQEETWGFLEKWTWKPKKTSSKPQEASSTTSLSASPSSHTESSLLLFTPRWKQQQWSETIEGTSLLHLLPGLHLNTSEQEKPPTEYWPGKYPSLPASLTMPYCNDQGDTPPCLQVSPCPTVMTRVIPLLACKSHHALL